MWARGLLAATTAAAFAVLVGLGVWQLQRLEWKEALISAARERPQAAAVAPPGPAAWPNFDIADWNYRRVRLTGTFGPREAHVWIALTEPRGRLGGPGYFVVAPFTTTQGWHVLVNRGFVPQEAKAPEDRPGAAPPAGLVTVEGLVRDDEPPNFATPRGDPTANRFFVRHIETLTAFLGLPADATAPYSVDLVAGETPAGGLPQAGESRLTFRNSHLGYALTWFGLAACLCAVVTAALVRRRGRGVVARDRSDANAGDGAG